MLKTVAMSGAVKTRGIAVTYRAGDGDKYATCPKTCELNCTGTGADKIDPVYFAALLKAVPRRGVSFTYSHFDWQDWAHLVSAGQTVVNYSAKDLTSAALSSRYVPTVTVVAPDAWDNGKTTNAQLLGIFGADGVFKEGSTVPVVRCPAEYREMSCAQCGDGSPLCARSDRSFIIGFTAHGAGKAKAADPDTSGGCYADGGRVRLHWDATSNADQIDETDAEKLARFAKSLPPGSILRHHVAGDIGNQ